MRGWIAQRDHYIKNHHPPINTDSKINLDTLSRQGMAPVLKMAMVAKLLMILIDSPMMWDVPKKIS